MTAAPPNLILYPVFAMVLLVAIVLMRMRSMRFGAVRRNEIRAHYYRAFQGEDEPEPLRVISRHFSNLFEMPVLFYAGVIIAYVTHQVTYWLVGCAWTFVALRYVHSWIHLTSNNVLARFSAFFASGLVLFMMWASLLVQLLRAG